MTDQEQKKFPLESSITVHSFDEFWGNFDPINRGFGRPLVAEILNHKNLLRKLDRYAEDQQADALLYMCAQLAYMRGLPFLFPDIYSGRHKNEYSEPRLRDKKFQH